MIKEKSLTNIEEIEIALDEGVHEALKQFEIEEEAKDYIRIENESIGEKLSPRQETFCRLYATDEEFFGNGVQAYLQVYDIDRNKKGWYETASVCASKLLSNAKVYNRINELLDDQGLNDAFVDKQILFLISQSAELGTKLSAIREYNALRNRITKKLELSGGVSIENITIE